MADIVTSSKRWSAFGPQTAEAVKYLLRMVFGLDSVNSRTELKEKEKGYNNSLLAQINQNLLVNEIDFENEKFTFLSSENDPILKQNLQLFKNLQDAHISRIFYSFIKKIIEERIAQIYGKIKEQEDLELLLDRLQKEQQADDKKQKDHAHHAHILNIKERLKEIAQQASYLESLKALRDMHQDHLNMLNTRIHVIEEQLQEVFIVYAGRASDLTINFVLENGVKLTDGAKIEDINEINRQYIEEMNQIRNILPREISNIKEEISREEKNMREIKQKIIAARGKAVDSYYKNGNGNHQHITESTALTAERPPGIKSEHLHTAASPGEPLTFQQNLSHINNKEVSELEKQYSKSQDKHAELQQQLDIKQTQVQQKQEEVLIKIYQRNADKVPNGNQATADDFKGLANNLSPIVEEVLKNVEDISNESVDNKFQAKRSQEVIQNCDSKMMNIEQVDDDLFGPNSP